MKAVMTVGVSASGKTTWAEEYVAASNQKWVNINRDDIRAEIFEKNRGTTFSWPKWNWKWETLVTAKQSEMIGNAIKHKHNIIISDTNLNPKYRDEMFIALTEAGYAVELKFFEVSFEEALRRDASRPNGVGVSVLAKQFEQWHEQFGDHHTKALLKHRSDRASAILVDVDGTLANHVGIRSPFAWDEVDKDTTHDEVVDIVRAMYTQREHRIVIVSGRDSVCRAKTEKWLQDNNIRYDDIYMRAENDMRSDDIVKKEILVNQILPLYNVKMVIDDRPRVCNMWRSLGITVVQVGNPYIFF